MISVPSALALLAGAGAALGGVSPDGNIDVLPERVDRWFFTSDLPMRVIATPVNRFFVPESGSSERWAAG